MTESLYIHWPFCPYRCHFCPFIALAGQDEFMPRYHQALKAEIIKFAHQEKLENNKTLNNSKIKTIFFGGGTPSTYPNELLLDIAGILRKEFSLAQDCEISFEVNPGTVDRDKLEVFKEAGINRLSIGVQSLNNKVLEKLNRHQKAEDVVNLVNQASQIIGNISVDLIVGLPGISAEEWKELIYTVVTWPIKHVSVYFLTVHEDTPLYFGVKRNKFILPPDDEIVDLYYWTIDVLERNGLQQYEVSNFSQPGYECKHNQTYWARNLYKGFGLGACSFDGYRRFQNTKNLLNYLESIEKNEEVIDFKEALTQKDIWLERLMLGLRQTQGVFLDQILELLTVQEQQEFIESVNLLKQKGLLKITGKSSLRKLLIEKSGLSVVNEITVKLSKSIDKVQIK